jgi:hypothetical protein
LVELGLFLEENQWFRMKTHFLMGRYFDFVVTDKFAIARGVDAHRVIVHGFWSGFLPSFDTSVEDDLDKQRWNEKDEQFVFIPRLQTMEFIHTDQANTSHSYLIGLTLH